MHLTRPNLGQPILITIPDIASGVDFVIASEAGTRVSDLKNFLKVKPAIRPVDQKEVRFTLAASGEVSEYVLQ